MAEHEQDERASAEAALWLEGFRVLPSHVNVAIRGQRPDDDKQTTERKTEDA
jgi:hypothetical protein